MPASVSLTAPEELISTLLERRFKWQSEWQWRCRTPSQHCAKKAHTVRSSRLRLDVRRADRRRRRHPAAAHSVTMFT